MNTTVFWWISDSRTGTAGSEYLLVLKEHASNLFTAIQPDFVFYQAGADVLETDKMGRLRLTRLDCRDRGRVVFEACKRYEIPIQINMGGGYSEDIKKIVSVHCQTFREGIGAMLY